LVQQVIKNGSVRFYFIPPWAGQSFAKLAKPSCILSASWRLCVKHFLTRTLPKKKPKGKLMNSGVPLLLI